MKYIKHADLIEAISNLQDYHMDPTASAAQTFKNLGALNALNKITEICWALCKDTAEDDDNLINALNDNPFESLLATADAAARWGITEDTIRKAIKANRLEPGRDCQKYGKQWVISTDAMIKVFGPLI